MVQEQAFMLQWLHGSLGIWDIYGTGWYPIEAIIFPGTLQTCSALPYMHEGPLKARDVPAVPWLQSPYQKAQDKMTQTQPNSNIDWVFQLSMLEAARLRWRRPLDEFLERIIAK